MCFLQNGRYCPMYKREASGLIRFKVNEYKASIKMYRRYDGIHSHKMSIYKS